MKLKASNIAAFAAIGVFALALPIQVFAGNLKLKEKFNNNFDETWYFVNFEDNNGVFSRNPGVECGVDACAELKHSQGDKYLRVSVNPSTTAGIYTNTDVSEVELGLPTSFESGQWTATPGHPVVMKSKVRWNSAYNIDGSGSAVGTSGIILWNSAVSEFGPMPEYDQIGFLWTSTRSLGGFLAGLTASAVVDLQPLAPLRPSSSEDINDWVDLKLVWSEDIAGVQSVEYFVNHTSIGITTLPVKLQNLSVEIWNDNQEPTFTPTGFSMQYPSPSVVQNFDVNKVVVEQN